MDRRPTVRLLESSLANEKKTSFGIKRDESYPPNVRLPTVPVKPMTTSATDRCYILLIVVAHLYTSHLPCSRMTN